MFQIKDTRRTILILLALFAGGFVPIQLITLSFGYAQYIKQIPGGPKAIMTAHIFARYYIWFLYLPALIALIGIIFYTKRTYPDVYRRIVVGLGVGLIATVALDFFRQMGVLRGWLPGDTPVMFGKMATLSKDLVVYYSVGFIIHFLNGANFGLVYAFLWGKRENYKSALAWSFVWILFIELGMMTLPPVAPARGLFGANYAWPQIFLLSLVAHIAFGIVLGILTQFFLKEEDKGGIFAFLAGK